MKKTKRNGKSFAAVALIGAMLASVVVGGGYLLGDNHNDNSLPNSTISASADTTATVPSYISYPSGGASKLGRFVNGYKYLYTDKGLMANMHSGAITEDMTTATVVSASNVTDTANTTWGKSASDPYVIYSIEDWEIFVQELANDSNLGSGKFYALAQDLDFTTSKLPASVPQFHMAGVFQGTFYGLGHSIKNIDWDNTTTAPARNDYVYYNKTSKAYAAVTGTANYTNGGFGVFGKLNNAVVADLVVENFSYKNVPQVASAGIWSSSSIGGVVGVAYGTSFVLNCQTNGYISEKPSSTGTDWGWPAGVVGCSNGTMTIYRCSAEVEVQVAVASGHGASAGGIIGDVVTTTSCNIYDCAANLKVNATQGKYSHCGACVAWSNGTIKIENFVGSMDFTDNSVTPYSGQMGGSNVATTLKNVYVDGKQGATAGNASNLNLVPWTSPSVSNVGTVSNLNVVRVGNDYHARHANAKYIATANTIHATRAALLSAAKSAVGATSKLPAAVWDASKVDLATYTPANSPVRHFMKTAVKYYNYTTTSETQYEYPTAGKTDAVEVHAGNNLYVPTNLDANREFVGWTTDKNLTPDKVIMGDNVFTTVPFHLLGENNLYAVWKAKNVTLSIVPTGNGMTTNAETGAKELVYNGSGITLSAVLSVTGITNPTTTHQWTKGGEDIKVGGTGDSYTVVNVDDSGVYNVSATYQSKTEPLYFGTITLLDKDAVTATIKPAPLECTAVTFKPDTETEPGEHAYSGAPYTSVTPIPAVYNTKGEKIKGTAKWAYTTGFFNDPDPDMDPDEPDYNMVHRGDKLYEKMELIFEPDEEYGGNYGTSVRFKNVEVEIEFLKFTFYIPEYDEMKLSFDLEYGNSYSFGKIADKFEELFNPYMGDRRLKGYSPAFVVNEDEDPVKINEYRALSFNGQTTAYSKVTSNRTLNVVFEYQTYTVKYDSKNGLSDYYLIEKDVGHNLCLESPENPKNGDKLFLGWYYTTVDPDTKKETDHQWDFNNNRVTRELVLFAKWLEANEYAGLTVTLAGNAEFNALEEVNPNYLIVTAKFKGTDEETGKKVERDVILSNGANGYSISYNKPDGLLHITVDENGQKTDTITISYSYTLNGDSHTDTVSKKLSVKPKLLDTEKVLTPFFKPSTAVYDGDAHNIKINTNVYSKFRQIKDDEIVYVYYEENGDEIDADNVIERQKYTVIATFPKVGDDYEAPSIRTTLEIIDEPITLTVEWGETTFVYNGKVQIPEPTFTDPDGYSVDPNYHLVDRNDVALDDLTEEELEDYTGDLKAIEANKSGQYYTVTIVFDDHGYTAIATEKTVRFQITQAEVEKPEQIVSFDYRGEVYDLNNLDPDEYLTYFSGFDPDIMEAVSGDITATDAGTYGVTIKLKNPTSAKWKGATSSTIDLEWKIKKAVLRVSWEGSTELIYTGGIQVPKVNSLYTIFDRDKSSVDIENDLLVSGDSTAHEIGEYKISVAFRTGMPWTKNYELNDTRFRSFSIIREGVEIVYVKWDKQLVFDYNGTPQKPNYILTWGTADGEPLSAEELKELARCIQFNDEALKSKYEGNYTAEVSLNAAGQMQYHLKGDLSCPYSIILNEKGEGKNPGASGPDEGDNPGNNTLSGIPLWQLIVGGVSALLFVICTLKSYGEYNKAKAAKKETKQLASQSYYGIVPLPLLAMGAGVKFWGLEETPWTIIALVAAGLFLISAATLFVMTKKRKKAELALAREQARIAEEKELAKEEEQMRREEEQRLREEQMRAEMREEQARRDNEFKMMFAAMQQNYQQPQMQYGDMQNMIASTISALLPAMQQQMALPPAQGDQSAYSAPQPNYGAPNYGAPNNEAEELRAMMAQQQAQMAQQQELINQLLQNQQAQQNAPAYDYEEEPVDDISWLGESDEVVSLEESYGALSDEEKRAYYDIGSYIMSKPQVSQNDGRYAVLFKYRGRTLFKLAIKDGAPVLYYPLNGGRGEVSIADPASLETAKSMIDRSVSMIDSQLN